MLVLKVLWLLLPAAGANMAPVFAKSLFPNWNTPIDFGKKWNGKELFGSHKTYRGMVCGTLVGLVIFYLQQVLFRNVPALKELYLFNYDEITSLAGAWIGFTALLGDLVKSFFKRALKIAPGEPWIPFDQIDWIIGTLLGVSIFVIPDTATIIISLTLGTLLHFFIKYVGYLWKLSPTPL